MKKGYFHRVTELTPTRFWINNPSRDEADKALAEGAVGCTCNPSYCQKMVDHPSEGPTALALLDDAVKESRTDTEAEIILQRELVKPIADKFLPIYESSAGEHGYVSIQGDPVNESEPEGIIREAFGNRAVGKNICCKVPVTAAGLKALETLFAEGVPINATEIMSISQAIELFDLHDKTAKRTGRSPKLYMSHIAGIYDDYMKLYVEREKVDISPDVLWQAGLAVARKLYLIMQERGYNATFIAGGARGLHHFTEMVGGDVVVTINWVGTADKLLESDPPVMYRLFNPVPDKVIDELMEKLPDFRKAYLEDGLPTHEYEEFGPVELFRSMFIKSWKRVLELAKERRAALT